MTLYRQLVIFTLALFLILFSGTWYAKLESTRTFILNQLESHAQDTASSLGLAASQYPNDMVSLESMVQALFDRGYYETIKFVDIEGKTKVERNLMVVIEGVPQWFISMVPIKAPEAESLVMAGWSQLGTVHVKSHAGYAYNNLWQDTVRTTLFFLGCMVFVLVAGGFGLRLLLMPLVRVEHQADALCRKEYEIQEKIPRTRELRRVVEAMNRMTLKVKEMFAEQVSHAESLRERAYNDPLTGLGNRRYFESQVTARLDRKDSVTKGSMMLIRIYGLDKLNAEKGFVFVDGFLKKVGGKIHETTGKLAGAIAARLSGSDFTIFMPDYHQADAERIAAEVSGSLAALAVEEDITADNICNIGVCTYDFSVSLGRLLAEADLALGAAIQAGNNTWSIRSIAEEGDKSPQGQRQWRELLEKALKDRSIELHAQPVVKISDRNAVVHLEIFSRIVLGDGEVLSAGVFMPLAERLKLSSSLDRLVIEEVLKLDKAVIGCEKVAVNVSPVSLLDETFMGWLDNVLWKIPPKAPSVIFEFAETGAVANEEAVKNFANFVRECGHNMALDHYGQSCGSLRYLQSLKPDYVKIDRAYTTELKKEDSDSRFFVGSICSVAHSIDVTVIAEGVETESQVLILQELNIDAIQGYVVDRPKPVRKTI